VDIGTVAGQEVAHVAPKTPEADLFFQAQGLRLLHEVVAARPRAEYIKSEGSSGLFGFSKDREQKPVILD